MRIVWIATSALLCIFISLATSRPLAVDVLCHKRVVKMTAEIPHHPNGLIVVFVPGQGYIDRNGKMDSGSNQAAKLPPEGVFGFWAKPFQDSGTLTVQYDKFGVGQSGGGLRDEGELALHCVLDALDSLGIRKEEKTLFFTFRDGYEVLRHVIHARARQGKPWPKAIIHQGYPGRDVQEQKNGPLPRIQLLEDSVASATVLTKQKAVRELLSDNLSQDLQLVAAPLECGQAFCGYRGGIRKKVIHWVLALR